MEERIAVKRLIPVWLCYLMKRTPAQGPLTLVHPPPYVTRGKRDLKLSPHGILTPCLLSTATETEGLFMFDCFHKGKIKDYKSEHINVNLNPNSF
jgi:hypothetical protein